ncbi:FtsH protease activity modulator HflK [Desulfofustis limnaeus]|jgi:membrane protease subunit HflK|uniref:Protein HflK n=1 Tax=Desulfofustis limnaeus TaxID=2740163 RepID=A0ABN6M2L2_9BACT|nr:FtsH protease activity modulator HflK [Desulfofustis limnaeus]MDX9894634.1 FtsH protease activity modulator HflK [Desulfofustis sp.]BDD86100.1 HflK protein [Desulfofustis limnaeus]
MSNHDQQPPWGRKKRPQTPEEIVAQLIKKLQDFFSESKKPRSGGEDAPPRGPVNPFSIIGKVLILALIVVALQGAYQSFYKVDPNEVGVVLRFGEYHRTTEPGLHLKIPYLEHLFKVNVRQIQKLEFGFRTSPGGQRSSFESRTYDMESLMLTADTNVINVAWIVQYRVKDPISYLFKVQDVKQAVFDLSESVTRRVVGNMDFDYVLSNRDLLAAQVREELQREVDNLETGVELVAVQFQDINPPDPVKPAFNEVNEADQDMKRLVNEAEEQYNRVIPAARGNALKIVEEAHGYARERINNAEGETARFLDILAEYRGAPDVTRQRMYLETLQTVLPSVDTIYVIDEGQQGPLPLLNLSGAAKPAPAQNGQ